ncbi:MAG: hypothetical protein CMO16_04235 [Thaumarchaeota archaeon]|nr:hypothetical protein [Nitrososphaerota archaeon]
MYKYKYVIIITVIIFLFLSPLNESFSQSLTSSTNQKTYVARDTLVVFGKSIPNDSLIAELFSPGGSLILRTQIDVGVEGSFSKILMVWPTFFSKELSFGTYTLVLTSSINEKLKSNLVFRFADISTPIVDQERKLDLQVSILPHIGKNEITQMIVEISINGVLVKGNADDTLKGSRIYYPDRSVTPLDNFTTIHDGIYLANFSSIMLGHHTIHIQAFYQGMLANDAHGIFVEEGPILSLGKEINNVNENLKKLREETIKNNNQLAEKIIESNNQLAEMDNQLAEEITKRNNQLVETDKQLASAVEEVGKASGQVSSLLLPIMGMIVVIIALQATILSRRSKQNDK